MSDAKIQAKILLAMQLQVRFICHQQQHYELNCSQGYDTKASLLAISSFERMALSIQTTNAQEMLEQLQARVAHAKKNCQMPGQYNGGIGTYGSLLANLEYWYRNDLNTTSHIKLWFNNQYKSGYLNFIHSNFYDHLRFQYHYEKPRWLTITGIISLGLVVLINTNAFG